MESADSTWSSQLPWLIKYGSWRLCIDYRELNAVTEKDAYLLPRIDNSPDALPGSTYFSILDLLSGCWQVSIDSEAQEKSMSVNQNYMYCFLDSH